MYSMFNSEKDARFSRIPENEDYEDLLPNNEALEPPRKRLPHLLPTVLILIFAISTSTISFWCGRKWDSTARPSSWMQEITNYCKKAQSHSPGCH